MVAVDETIRLLPWAPLAGLNEIDKLRHRANATTENVSGNQGILTSAVKIKKDQGRRHESEELQTRYCESMQQNVALHLGWSPNMGRSGRRGELARLARDWCWHRV